jgi:hypothetical protein
MRKVSGDGMRDAQERRQASGVRRCDGRIGVRAGKKVRGVGDVVMPLKESGLRSRGSRRRIFRPS